MGMSLTPSSWNTTDFPLVSNIHPTWIIPKLSEISTQPHQFTVPEFVWAEALKVSDFPPELLATKDWVLKSSWAAPSPNSRVIWPANSIHLWVCSKSTDNNWSMTISFSFLVTKIWSRLVWRETGPKVAVFSITLTNLSWSGSTKKISLELFP